jgi:hypothetical protein
MVMAHSALAQTPPDLNWAMPIPCTGHLTVTDMLCDEDGWPVVAGSFAEQLQPYEGHSYGALVPDNAYFLTYSSYRTLEEVSILYADGNTQVNSMVRDSAGHIYACGYFSGTASSDLLEVTSSGGRDVFVLKLSPSGKGLWLKRFGGTADDVAYGIDLAADGLSVYLCGAFASASMAVGTSTLNNASGTDHFFMARLDTTLNPLSAISPVTATGTSQATAIRAVSDGTVRATIDFTATLKAATNDVDHVSDGSYDILVTRWDSLLTTLTHYETLDGMGEARSVAMDVDDLGNTYVAGTFALLTSSGSNGVTSNGLKDAFVARFHPTLANAWIISGGGTLDDAAADVRVQGTDTILFAGTFQGLADFGIATLDNVVALDGFVLCLRADGTLRYTLQPGDEANEVIGAVATDGVGSIYVAGTFDGPTTLVGPSLTPLVAEPDGFLMAAGQPFASIAERDMHLTVYPNPFTDRLLIRSTAAIDAWTLTDMLGRPIATGRGNEVLLDHGAVPGPYVLLVQTGAATMRRILIKE